MDEVTEKETVGATEKRIEEWKNGYMGKWTEGQTKRFTEKS